MSLSIYHNPRCSKSRATLALIEEHGFTPDVVLYLESPPDAERIRELARFAGVSVSALARTSELEYRQADDLPAAGDDAALADWLARHPRVIQRPIVVDDDKGRAIIGRPPDNVRALLPRNTGADRGS